MQEVPGGTRVFVEEVERLLSSNTLRTTESLKRLLAYLAEAKSAGREREVKEYTIGRDVMGKPENYDPRVDASVRVQAGKLRQRLEQYYSTEAPDSAWQIRLPKGHFELVLEERAPAPAIDSPRPWTRRWPAGLALAAAGLVLGAAIGWMARSAGAAKPAGEEWTEELREYWAPFIDSKKPLTVVLGSPLFVRFHSNYYRDPLVNDWETAVKELPLQQMQELLKSKSPPSETHRWTPFGEAAAAFRLAAILSPRKTEMVLKRSSVLSWEDVRSSNLVFVGPRKFNPQIKDLPVEQDFIIDRGAVHNLRPRPGELQTYSKPSPANQEDIPLDYSVITRIRGVEGWGEILVLASSSTEGTWAAADYVTDPAHLAEMARRLKGTTGVLPDRYQVLLRSRFKSQVPIQTEYVTHHVLEPRKSR